MPDENNLEGTRTREELAENFRELDRIAPTPAEKFRLMFGHSSAAQPLQNKPTTKPMNIQELIEAVRQWGENKGITGPNGKGTLLGQLAKTQEELTETRDAAVLYSQAQFIAIRDGKRYETREELIDGIGDCAVTLILAAEMAGLRFEDCLAAAYDEIKGRTGTMVGGQFVKDGQHPVPGVNCDMMGHPILANTQDNQPQ